MNSEFKTVIHIAQSSQQKISLHLVCEIIEKDIFNIFFKLRIMYCFEFIIYKAYKNIKDKLPSKGGML